MSDKEQSPGAALIARERERQIQAEGWTAEHDDLHTDGQLAWGAVAYAMSANGDARAVHFWPFTNFWKPSASGDRVRDLSRAGALIAAEIDRLLRAQEGR